MRRRLIYKNNSDPLPISPPPSVLLTSLHSSTPPSKHTFSTLGAQCTRIRYLACRSRAIVDVRCSPPDGITSSKCCINKEAVKRPKGSFLLDMSVMMISRLDPNCDCESGIPGLHLATGSMFEQKHLSPRQWRLVTYLSKFDITFKSIAGKKNIVADLLSRIAERPTYQRDLPYLEESDAHLCGNPIEKLQS
jgi:hypothetical protein